MDDEADGGGMNLSEFPRPAGDNGRGVHWAASPYEWGKSDWPFWRKQILAMHLKWIKIIDDGGGSALPCARQLIDIGVMPVVRLYRPEQNPGNIGSRGGDAVKQYVKAGAMYFETNNEPDLALEWKGGKRPDNWLEVVVNDWIVDAGIILAEGGYPGFPAFGVGTQRDPFALVVKKGRADLFGKGAWCAVHNYCLARPLEYPNDAVNLEGVPLTENEWQAAGGMWAWEMGMEAVNKVRAANVNPSASITSDSTCFRAYEQVNALVTAAFGHSVPILTTEGGYNVGQRAGTTAGDDVRYAKPTPRLASELNARLFRFMDGSETVLGKTVPEYYFACMPWLIAAYRIGVWANPAENQGPWFTDKYNAEFGLHGELPLVQMLKEIGGRVRQEGPMPEQWMNSTWEQELGDAWDSRLKYLGVGLKAAPVAAPRGPYWKLVSAQWQDQDEVRGAGYIFVQAEDEKGKLIENATFVVARRDASDWAPTKGEVDGFWGNYAMRGFLGTYNVSMKQGGHPSETVTGLGLGLEDNHAVWTRTAFRLVFRLTAATPVPSPTPTPAPIPVPTPVPIPTPTPVPNNGTAAETRVKELETLLALIVTPLEYAQEALGSTLTAIKAELPPNP